MSQLPEGLKGLRRIFINVMLIKKRLQCFGQATLLLYFSERHHECVGFMMSNIKKHM